MEAEVTLSVISAVLHEAIRCLDGICENDADINAMVSFIHSVDVSAGDLAELVGHIPVHASLLESAISAIDDEQFAGLKAALLAAQEELHWKVDDGGYYADGADVGQGYKTGNMHALLVGPKDAALTSNDFLLGLFLLKPWTLYRDHKHLAPEIYVPLTGPSGWRFGLGEWGDHPAGSRILNAPDVPHATRVYETPFLALFAWTRDIDSICTVVSADDWDKIEHDLEFNMPK